ncbi:MAG: hypothetical protein AMXMBFR7_48740 [Planctomycetota bacterium]
MPHATVESAAFLDALQTEGGATRLLPHGIACQEHVVYGRGGDHSLTLDLFDRHTRPERKRPAIVFIHGGGWAGGDAKQFFGQAAYLAWKYGFYAVSVRYRLTDKAPFPACLQDVKAAMRWVRARAERWKIDPERIAVAGGSAGGHLAAMVALTPGVPDYEGDGGTPGVSSHANAAVLFNPVLDLFTRAVRQGTKEAVRKLLQAEVADAPQRFKDASPQFRLHPSAPPCLILHGANDTTVPPEQATAFHSSAAELGVPCELELYPDVGHGWFNKAPHFWPTLQRLERFLAARFQMQD